MSECIKKYNYIMSQHICCLSYIVKC